MNQHSKRPIRDLSLFHRARDRFFLGADFAYKIVLQQADEVFTLTTRIIGGLAAIGGVTISTVLGWTIKDAPPGHKSILLKTLRAFIGVGLVTAVTTFAAVILFIAGTFASLFGLRNLGEYGLKEQILAWGLLFLVLLLAPAFASEHVLFKIQMITALTLGVIGMEFLNGQCGIISLGHSGFLFVSGYVTTWLMTGTFGAKLPIHIAIAVAAAVNGVFGLLLGLPSLRVKDHYLVIITLTFSIAVPKILRSKYLKDYSGLREGGLFFDEITVPDFLSKIPPHIFKYLYVMVPSAILFLFAYHLIHYSQVGRAFRTIRCDSEVSSIMGIPVVRYKLFAFVMSSVYVGFAGGFLVLINRYISPDSYAVTNSIDFLAAHVMGGPGGLLGSVFGGTFLAYEPDVTGYLANLVPRGKDLARASYGFTLVAIILFLPQGVAGQVSQWLKAKFVPKTRRGRFQWDPPPDYDYMEYRKRHFKLK